NGTTYEAVIYGDDISSGNPEKLSVTKKKVTADDELPINMMATGGQAITFIPVK
ncbi:MAG: glycoside hydrolase family 97 C-terminal domain-containing protein, partial [Paramuribaculum sp.]|nr:glycoside hydrolase family 97 C-terminal domain-containing protein [Paramuribaculum sp.]